MTEKEKEEMVELITSALNKHHDDRDEKLLRRMKKEHYTWLNNEMGVNFKDEVQVSKLKGALRLGMAVYTFMGKMGLFIGITIVGGILTGLWHLISIGIKALHN